MDSSPLVARLHAAFVDGLPFDQRQEYAAEETLGARLAAGLALARQTHPDLDLDEQAFARHLATVLPGAEQGVEALDRLHMADLYLAHGCQVRQPRALAAFERVFGGDIDRAVAAAGPSVEQDDLGQRIRAKLLVGTELDPPKIAGYRGGGSLTGWIRVVASRMVVDVHRRRARGPSEIPVEPAMLADIHEAGRDPELAHMSERYRDEVHAAFERAFGALEDRERHLLRHQLVHQLGYDELGALYGVHRTTASRWVEAARARLVEHARDELMRQLGAGEATVDSVVALVRSQLELSVHRLLADPL